MYDSLDTNVVIRYIIGDIPEQRLVAKDFLSADDTVHHLADSALYEIVHVLEHCYEQTREEIATELDIFFARHSRHLDYNADLVRRTLPFYLSHPKLSWNDCALAADAELTHNEPLFTFDKALARQSPSAKLLK